MNAFPVGDAEIRELRAKVLRDLAATAHPRTSLGAVAHKHNISVDDVKSLVAEHGWPDPAEMRLAAYQMDGKVQVVTGSRPTPAPPPPPAGTGAIERLLADAAKSDKARTRKIAERINTQLVDLRALVIAERDEAAARAEAAERKKKLKAEAAELEKKLAAVRAELSDSGIPSKTIRAWAADNGIECSVRGQLSAAVREAYAAAHATPEGASQ